MRLGGAARAITILVLVVGAIGIRTPAPAGATPGGVHLTSQEFNLCELKCRNPGDPYHPKDIVLWMMAAQSPHQIALNEVCESTANEIGWYSGAGGPQFYVAVHHHPECPLFNGARRYGNVSWASGSSTFGFSQGFPYYTQHSGDTGKTYPEWRGFSCQASNTFVGYLYQCAAHMTPGSLSKSQEQQNAFAWQFASNPLVGGHAVAALSGDYKALSPMC